MRVVFMGTPEFAVPSLAALAAAGHDIGAVYTQPDRPAGRGGKLTPPPVKIEAERLGLPVEQPERVKRLESFERLQTLAPELIAVVGYGQIIPQRILDLPPHGCINVHSSLLPKYRGAAPINWAVVHGEAVTGVTTMRLVFKLDAGDILLQRETAIGDEETAADLTRRLAPIGAELLVETLAGLAAGTLSARPQDEAAVTFAPIMKREDGAIDWTLSARDIFNRVRGFDPWPGAYTSFRGKRLHLCRARPADKAAAAPGEIRIADGRLLIGCGDGAVEALEVQLEGKKRMPAPDFMHGYQPKTGETLS
jgi:methionyl-tRNA formyltransferase